MGMLIIAMAFTISATPNNVSSEQLNHLDTNSSSWQQVGNAELSILFWDIYKAKLYTINGKFERIAGPLKLEITYYIDIEGKDLVAETANQWQEMGLSHENDGPWLDTLLAIFPDLQENDRLAIQLKANGEGLFFHNGSLLHQFPASLQLQNFLGIWLSSQSTRPKLMAKLTGKS